MDGRYLPVPDDGFRHARHTGQEGLSAADGQLIDVADTEIVRRVLVVGNRLVQPAVILILRGTQRVAVGVLTVRGGDEFTEGVGEHEIQAMRETVLQAGLQRMEGGMAVVLSACVTVYAGKLRVRTQRLL